MFPLVLRKGHSPKVFSPTYLNLLPSDPIDGQRPIACEGDALQRRNSSGTLMEQVDGEGETGIADRRRGSRPGASDLLQLVRGGECPAIAAWSARVPDLCELGRSNVLTRKQTSVFTLNHTHTS
jgi:hypothetical protein